MSTYPTTAELTAMRRTFSECRHGSRTDDPMRWAMCPLSVRADTGGAWPHEREHGIGYSTEYSPYSDAVFVGHARREANAMRREAWEANEWNRALEPAAYGDERQYGVPVHSPCPNGCTLPAGHWGMHPIDDAEQEPRSDPDGWHEQTDGERIASRGVEW